jgi:hypothetical protein
MTDEEKFDNSTNKSDMDQTAPKKGTKTTIRDHFNTPKATLPIPKKAALKKNTAIIPTKNISKTKERRRMPHRSKSYDKKSIRKDNPKNNM